MSTAAFVRKYVEALEAGQLFSTREVLRGGKRGAVDQALYRLIKKNVIVRVVRGLFQKQRDRSAPKPSIREVAEAKAKAFGKQLWTHGLEAAQKFGIQQLRRTANNAYVFATDGASSSFRYGKTRIILLHVAPRKLRFKDTVPGLIIRAFCSTSRFAATAQTVAVAVDPMKLKDKLILRDSIAWMPQWLSDQLRNR